MDFFKIYKYIFFIAFLGYDILTCTAQNTTPAGPDYLAFMSFNASAGLSNSHVNAIGQDKKGFIWVGTNDGLNRFDGLQFQTFHYSLEDSASISSNTIFSIFTDMDENIWFGTFAGLCRYDYNKEQFIRYPLQNINSQHCAPIRGIAQTPDGYLWLATSGGGLIRMNPSNGSVANYRHSPTDPSSVCSDYLQAITVDNSGKIWVGSENKGISILDPKTNLFYNIDQSSGKIGNDMVLSMMKASDGKIWIGTFEGNVSAYNPVDQSFKTIKMSDKSLSVYGITEGFSDDIWFGTQEEGLFHFDGQRLDHFSNAKGNTHDLINDNIHALFTDNTGILWVGIFQGGVNYLKPRPLFTDYIENIDSKLNNKTVLGIYPESKESVYVCTDGDGLIIWNSVTGDIKQYKAGQNGLKTNSIRCAYKDHENRIWLGTYLKGLQEYHPDKNSFTGWENIPDDSTSLSNNDVTCIVEDRLGNLWIGTNGGLNLLDKATGKFRHFRKEGPSHSKNIISDHITDLYIDSHGYLWISTFWGLSKMDPAKGDVRNFEIIGNDNTYYCIFEDSKQRLWAGTTIGLKLLNTSDGTFKVFSTKDGLPSNMVNGIAEDDNGNLWLSTNQGICKFNYDKGTIRNFHTEDGLISNEFLHNSVGVDNDGQIYFGSVDGITKFHPAKLNLSSKPPRIVISDLLVFNTKIYPDDNHEILQNSTMENGNITLSWEDNSFTLIFKAIDYLQPQKITYATRMIGFDSNWSYYKYNQNSASYTNLYAGVYQFEVKASNDGETWSKPVVLKIRIIAPLWKRWWAIVLYCVTGLGIITMGFLTYRKNHTEKQEARIQYIKQQNDIELNKSRLQFFTNISHEFRTPLTLIMSPLEQMLSDGKYDNDDKSKFSLMFRNAKRLLHMVNQIMDIRKIDNSKLQLNPIKDDLVAFVREIHENFNQLAYSQNINFRFKSELKEFQAYFDKELIDKALYNLLSNAFKFTPEYGTIEMSIRRPMRNDTNSVVIIVEDNGRGIPEDCIDKIFERFFQGDTSSMQQGTGIGLWLTKQFIEMHHGIISVSSQVGKGTAFTIMLTNGDEFQNMAKENSDYNHIRFTSVIEEMSLEKKLIVPEEDSMGAASKPTILIVEDNLEIRSYIAEGLSKLYDVKTASNGNEGLEITRQSLPDLVITDIMMPDLNGIELCSILKSDIETCHIPIIMLTARNSEEQRIEGLETGADSYITKPFNPKHLLVRIEKLLELRKTLREKFGSDVSFETEQAGITIPDRDLLKKVTSVIKKRISDTKLTVETLAEEIGISRGHLQRKLKNLTGQNPNEFIRIIRLKQAAEILCNNDVTIAEVADMVGFNSQSYFSTAFTKQFNISPSQYVEENKGKNN